MPSVTTPTRIPDDSVSRSSTVIERRCSSPRPAGRYRPMGAAISSLPWSEAIPASRETTLLVTLQTFQATLPVCSLVGPSPIRQLCRKIWTFNRFRVLAKVSASATRCESSPTASGSARSSCRPEVTEHCACAVVGGAAAADAAKTCPATSATAVTPTRSPPKRPMPIRLASGTGRGRYMRNAARSWTWRRRVAGRPRRRHHWLSTSGKRLSASGRS